MKKIFSFVLVVGLLMTMVSYGAKAATTDKNKKWQLINYWATWCEACQQEIPELNRFYQKNSQRVKLVGVIYDQVPSEELPTIASQYNINYPLRASYPLSRLGVRQIEILPTTFVINPDGKLVKILKGPQTQRALEKAIQ